MASPTVYGPVELTDVARVSSGFCSVAAYTTLAGLETAGPAGGVQAAVALSCTEPAATSAAVTVGQAVQVVDSSGASVATGQAAAPSSNASSTVMPVNGTLPVLVTTNS